MSLRRCVQSVALPQVQIPTSGHIWISDDILDRALRRFLLLRCSRRRGSSVPGPFEAQRRANKRRMMGLATVGAPEGTYDPGLFGASFGRKDQQKWQWQAPTAVEPPKTLLIAGIADKGQALSVHV